MVDPDPIHNTNPRVKYYVRLFDSPEDHGTTAMRSVNSRLLSRENRGFGALLP